MSDQTSEYVPGDAFHGVTAGGIEWRGIIRKVYADRLVIQQARGLENRPGVAVVYRDDLR
jgi:hypothetical protein